MKIQSLSVVVPAKKCINDCKFCVSKMHTGDYKNQLDENLPFYDLYIRDYIKRLEFARDNGCNTVMLTGDAEPQQNRSFLKDFGLLMMQLERPFRWVEMQTTGVLLDEPYLRFLRNHVGVNTISVSLSSLDDVKNAEINGTPKNLMVDLWYLCHEIKRYDFNLRLSINLTKEFGAYAPDDLFEEICDTMAPNQITFRSLYSSGVGVKQDTWIEENACSKDATEKLLGYIKQHGSPLEKLPYGATKYSLFGMSVVLDDDCMSKEAKEDYKYLVLRPDCKLYSKWDETASLIF